MRLTFRQGIVRFQTDINGQSIFLQKSTQDAQFVDLNVSPDPTIIAFAHRGANYIYEEARGVKRAWGPFTTNKTAYLYWDINVLTGELTRGFTYLPPLNSGVEPHEPAVDQHWFDTENTLMKVWNGAKWIEKIRVFAAAYSSSAVIKGYSLGSQVGINVDTEAGNIVLDSYNKPLRQSDGSFVTSTTGMSVVGIATKKIRIEGEILNLLATEYIPKFNCVQARSGRTAIMARSNNRMSRVSGIAVEDMYQGETSIIISSGLLRNEMWNWPAASVNRPLFCNADGELTLTPPSTGVLQQVGSVYDTDCIYVHIYPSITLDHPDGIYQPPLPDPISYPVANFTAQPLTLTGNAPLLVNFVDLSTGGPITSYEWDFTNDGSVDATTQNPSYTFASPGTYSVRLKVRNLAGANEVIKTQYVVVGEPLAEPGKTNLDVRITINGQEDNGHLEIPRGDNFTVRCRISNIGTQTAHTVTRVFIVFDVDNQQVTPMTPIPAGLSTSRGIGYNQILFTPVASMVPGGVVDVPAFTLRAPILGSQIRMEAVVRSADGEVDADTTNNNRALTVRLVS
jgi:PKD repeat protein